MSSGLYSGVSGLALGVGLNRGVSGLWGGASGLDAGFGSSFAPTSLFAAGEQGVWYDPSDLSTMFQDSAGSTPVTAAGQSVGRILDKSGRGNHATQATAASRPVLGRVPDGGRRNLLTFTEQFDNSYWNKKTNLSVSANAAVDPLGGSTADALVENSSTAIHEVAKDSSPPAVTSSTAYTMSVYLKANGRNWAFINPVNPSVADNRCWFDLQNGVTGTTAAGCASTITSVGSGWYHCTVSLTTSVSQTAIAPAFGIATGNNVTSYLGDGTSGILIWGAQLETGSTATAYQRVVTAFDVTEAGKADCYYLSFDGTDDFMLTSNITPGTDKAQVFAGVRKLSDAGAGVIAEMSVNLGLNVGTFFFLTGNLFGGGASYAGSSRGTATAATNQGTVTAVSFPAPITNVVTGLFDIPADLNSMRVDGFYSGTPATGDQGAGNYLTYPLYIGRRGGASLPLNGQIFSLIVRFGANLPDETIAQTEAWQGQRVAPTVSTPQLGPNLILNGGFASSADWVPTGGWSISAGAARQASVGFGNIIYQAQALTTGARYAATFTVSSISSGSIGVRLSGATIVASATFTAPGTYTVYVVAPVSTTQFDIVAATSTVAVVDDVSLRLVS